MPVKYVVAYDVSEDPIRLRVARTLQQFGQRVQGSVFECHFSKEQLDECVGLLKAVLQDPENGNIRIYRLCESCEFQSVGMGNLKPTLDQETCLII